jgi:hypothetical protein
MKLVNDCCVPLLRARIHDGGVKVATGHNASLPFAPLRITSGKKNGERGLRLGCR